MRMKTLSNNFYNDEIKGILDVDGQKVIYLKEGVKRRRYIEDMSTPLPEELDSQLNTELLNFQSMEKFYKIVMGLDDYEDKG